ncbi:hypothetical protein Hanom_Chr05g00425931 [Helianthus anomalus]
MSDLKETKEAYDKLNKAINLYRDASRENEATITILKSTVMDKQIAINNHMDTVSKLKHELETVRIETERVDKKLISYSTTSYVLDHILSKPTGKDESGKMCTVLITKGWVISKFHLLCGIAIKKRNQTGLKRH